MIIEGTGYRNEIVVAPFVFEGQRLLSTALQLVADEGKDNIGCVPTVTMWVASNYTLKLDIPMMRRLADAINLACDIAETMTVEDEETK